MTTNEQVGPYEILERLGVGGMAETFVARRLGPDAFRPLVCLKRVLPALAGDDAFLAMLRSEAQLGAALRHRSIVRVLDFGLDGRAPYLVLELIDGVDLRAILSARAKARERLPVGVVAYVGLRIAEALEHAHTTSAGPGLVGLVHRDISPSNVLLSTTGEVKLSDFGIAKAFGSDGPTRTTALKGKIPYMAPEYAHTGRADARTDLFALGVVLYESLAGRRPYRADGDAALLAAMRDGRHPPLADLTPDAPTELVALVDSCVASDADVRPPNAAAVVDALSAFAPRAAQHEVATWVVGLHRPVRRPPAAPAVEPSIEIALPPVTSVAEATLVATHHPNAPVDGPARSAPAEAPTGTRIGDARAPFHDPDAPTRTQVATARIRTRPTAARLVPWLVGVALMAGLVVAVLLGR